MNYKNRLVADYMGKNGDFWKTEAQKCLKANIGQYEKTQAGAIIWKSSKNPVPQDILELLTYAKVVTEEEYELATVENDKITKDFLAAYKKNKL